MDAITTVVVTIAAVFLSFCLITRLMKNKSENQNLPPSPPSIPLLGHLHHFKMPLHKSLAGLSARYGPILLLRFGIRRVLTISSAALAEECFTTNDVALAGRPHLPSAAVFSYNYTVLGLASYGTNWREMRRIFMVEALSGHRLDFFADVWADEARALARGLLRDSGSVEDAFATVQLRPRLFGLAMNIMTRITYGKRYYGEGPDMDRTVHRFKKVTEEVFSLSGASNIGDFLPSVLGWITRWRVGKKLSRAYNYRDQIFQSLIDERRRKRNEGKEKKARKAMIDALLSLQEEQPEQCSDVFIKAVIVAMLSAGIDTSSNTIEWAMSLLLNNPEKLDKAREEIERQVGNNRLIEESDLANNLPYLHCIITETLRVYPVAPLLLPHEVREECKVGGYDIPVGTMILVNAYAIHRDPDHWKEPSRFLPERFVDAGKSEGGRILPFGMGRRKCPGEGLAMREVGLVLGTLIQCFEWKKVGEEAVDMTEGFGITMPRAHPLVALCKPRQVMINLLSQL